MHAGRNPSERDMSHLVVRSEVLPSETDYRTS